MEEGCRRGAGDCQLWGPSLRTALCSPGSCTQCLPGPREPGCFGPFSRERREAASEEAALGDFRAPWVVFLAGGTEVEELQVHRSSGPCGSGAPGGAASTGTPQGLLPGSICPGLLPQAHLLRLPWVIPSLFQCRSTCLSLCPSRAEQWEGPRLWSLDRPAWLFPSCAH